MIFLLKAPLIQSACRLDWSWGNDRQRKGAVLNQEGLTETVVPPHTLALNLQRGACLKAPSCILLKDPPGGFFQFLPAFEFMGSFRDKGISLLGNQSMGKLGRWAVSNTEGWLLY